MSSNKFIFNFNCMKNLASTFVMIKPNGIQGNIIGEILHRYESSRLSISAMKMGKFSPEKIGAFYAEHQERPFFGELVNFISSSPIVVLSLYGDNAIVSARSINGATNPAEAASGTIRYDFAPNVGSNVVHSSDSTESASREIAFWFSSDEISNRMPTSKILEA